MIIIWMLWLAFFLYLIAIERRLLFYLWFWQIKQYYIKRVVAEIREGKWQIIFPKITLLKLALLFAFLFSTSFFLLGAIIIIFLFFGIYLFENLLNFYQKNKRIKLPKPTFKNLPLFVASHLFILGIIFYCLFLQPKTSFLDPVFFLVLIDIFLFFEVALIVFLFLLGEWAYRKVIIYLATRKIKKMKNLITIGITGSYGKTSTKEILYFILSKKFKAKRTPGHLNTDPAIARFILKNIQPDDEVFIVEMAAYSKGEIIPTCKMTQPKIGIISGVNEQHLSLFKTMENLLSAEGGWELIQSLPKEGLVILNGNNKYCQDTYHKIKSLRKRITFAKYKESPSTIQFDLVADNIEIGKQSLKFDIFFGEEKATFMANLVGQHHIENILLAVMCAKELGFSLKEIAEIVKEIPQEIGSMRLIKTKDGLNVIDATYSANPDGVLSALEYLKVWKGRKAVVMPCLIELGEKAKEIHQKIGKKIAEICDFACVTTSDFFQDIQKGALENGMQKEKIVFISDPDLIYQKLKNFDQEEDIILLEGRVPTGLKHLLGLN